jgi:acetyl esterase
LFAIKADVPRLAGMTTLFQLLLLVFTAVFPTRTQSSFEVPMAKVYKTVGDVKLTAHVFRASPGNTGDLHPAIVLFHGGGWVSGSPDWVYDAAKRYASSGAVAVAAEYRLSDQKSISPLDAMADARDIVHWMRLNSAELSIDSDRIAAYGVSAGGQLAASLATIDDGPANPISPAPNAMVFISPAVSVEQDGWFQKLLGNRATAKDLSPSEHITKRIPPTIIFHGIADSLVPITGVKRYCDRAKQFGSVCELHAYPGVGHLFTRKLDNQEDSFDPDPKVVADAKTKGDQFLFNLGFLPMYRELPDTTAK